MKFKLKAYTIYELGQRKRQEDSIFPHHNATKDEDRLFIVCDGMGGHSGGNIASAAVCEAMSTTLASICPDAEGSFTDDDLRTALSAAYDSLDAKDDGSEKKMGTTMTLLKFHDAGCTIAHIGDSRVYHVRPGADAASTEILFQTQDHSLVNDLVRIGELTPEQAKTSNQRNIITRAMQPNMGRRSRADIYHTTDIRPGDYFMLCTDGILEQMEDDNIKFIFSDKGGDAAQKVDMLVKVTAENHDNHSAMLVQVTDVEGLPVVVVEPEPVAPVSAVSSTPVEPEYDEAAEQPVYHASVEEVAAKHLHSRKAMIIFVFGICAILAGTIYFFAMPSSDEAPKSAATTITTTPSSEVNNNTDAPKSGSVTTPVGKVDKTPGTGNGVNKSGNGVGSNKSGKDNGGEKPGNGVGDNKSGKNNGDEKPGNGVGDNKSGNGNGGDKSSNNQKETLSDKGKNENISINDNPVSSNGGEGSVTTLTTTTTTTAAEADPEADPEVEAEAVDGGVFDEVVEPVVEDDDESTEDSGSYETDRKNDIDAGADAGADNDDDTK